MYLIEKGIPMPTKLKEDKYPFRKMAVGDSFFFQKEDSAKIKSAMNTYFKKTGTKFFVAPDMQRASCNRCWRIR